MQMLKDTSLDKAAKDALDEIISSAEESLTSEQ